MKKFVLFFTLLAMVHLSFAIDASTSLRKYLKNNEKIKANFTQTVTNGKKTTVTSGELIIFRPNRFKWIYQTNSKQLIIANGQEVNIYDQDLKQVIKKPLAQIINKSPAAILAGSDNLSAYRIENIPSHDGYSWYKLTIKNPSDNNEMEDLMFAFDQAEQLKQIRYHDVFKNYGIIVLSNVSNKLSSADQDFNFKIPEGVDVIDDTKKHQ